ncbi:hypothetical protein CK503_12770 [Aliifodinibius salipaludis]|uniref:Secretion system C-terminal sorting domain-containing protein n=1 Tax=Fodinibius salipaludis TaxID=2032627 RepID=A0A2A2G8U9_9BACT|nr:T9SS type A sorting domain-containing protein [Aliifodinibius salipaludis]PAU93289.1 hypothetical protein CK503_12770 [Aliifodinibius salipaludis]
MGFAPTEVHAQTKTWTGNIDSEWHKAGNWTPNGVPGPSNDVQIRPNNGNPYPIITEQNVTVVSIQVTNYDGGELTVSGGRTLTITDGLTFADTGTLFIQEGGAVNLTGNSFDMGYGNTLIDISTGSFTSETDITIKGDGFNAGSGTVTINGDLKINNDKVFNVESGDITVSGITNINGTYNGDDGITTFHGAANVESGGIINLDTGTINFNEGVFIGNNGTANLGSGTVNIDGNTTISSSGYFNVQDATVNITGDADFTSNGNLSVNNGSINVEGDASLSGGGTFDFNNGSLSVGENASFTGGGTVNAGNAEMEFKGDLEVPYGGTFNAGTSTVTFSGSPSQINTNGDDLSFYNVEVSSGSTLQTDGSSENTITIENDLTVEEGGQVEIQDDDTIDIQGNLDNQGTINSQRPFVYDITTPSLTKVLIEFDQEMDPQSTGQLSNYSINKGISINSLTFNTSNKREVLLDVSSLTENVEYELEVNNVKSAAGGQISQNHIKRFIPIVDITYYSRQSGSWDDPTSWSTESHTGNPASEIPNDQDGEGAIVGNNHTITLDSKQDISNLNELTIDNTGTLAVSSGDTLVLNEFIIIGGGTFDLQNNGTLQIGSAEGISSSETNTGNIQTEYRNFSSSANYWYQGTANQNTGSGLPQQVNDLRIDNSEGVTATNNLQINSTLYLQNGSLTIPSGQGLIANNKSISNGNLTFTRILSGEPGWRMLSSPVSATVNNFLSNIITQGYEGAYYDASVAPNDTLQPNVLYYDETFKGTDNQRWRVPSSASNQIDPGLGYHVYLFGDVVGDERYNDTLPDTLSVTGQEHSGLIDLNVTYTAEADTGWNLVGNPYGAPINWDNSSGWTKTNIDQTIYIWEPDDNSYKTWNGSTGTLANGIIPPFQAFWVKANAPQNNGSVELSVTGEAKTLQSAFNFVGKRTGDANPEIELHLKHEGTTNRMFFSFYEDAKVGKDSRDAYHLQPPPETSNYAELFSIGRRNNRYNINALPITFGVPIEIPISANVVRNSQKVTESVNLQISDIKNIPSSWDVTLIDRITGQEITPSKGTRYSFKTSGEKNSKGEDSQPLQKDYQILSEADPSKARFALRIDPGALGTGLPKEIDLKQNYPNPFNPTTTIRFTLPIQNEVTLEVFNILGRKVATLFKNKSFQAGLHSINWNASNVASGTYIYRLTTDEKVVTKKMTLIK